MNTSGSARHRPLVAALPRLVLACVFGWLAGCASGPAPAPSDIPQVDAPRPVPAGELPPFPSFEPVSLPGDDAALPAPRVQANSRWLPVRWAELPGFMQDDLGSAWLAWIRSCDKPGPVFAPLCADVRRLAAVDDSARRAWMMGRLQPYRVEPLQGRAEGLLTGYYEPVLEASRVQRPGFDVPLFRPPANLGSRKPWFSRQEIDTVPQARAALAGRELVWLADPVDAMSLQIQGSGQIRVTEVDGSQRMVRLAYAGTNDQPYKSVGRWLVDQGAVRDGSWPTIRAWITKNPDRVQALVWSNPRVVFFREEAVPADASSGPRGAQGVPLTAGRSIAVDPQSIPYATPVWLATTGLTLTAQRLVLAQDTGTAIRGAVRADFYAGSGDDAGQLAGRLKQPLALWALWPK